MGCIMVSAIFQKRNTILNKKKNIGRIQGNLVKVINMDFLQQFFLMKRKANLKVISSKADSMGQESLLKIQGKPKKVDNHYSHFGSVVTEKQMSLSTGNAWNTCQKHLITRIYFNLGKMLKVPSLMKHLIDLLISMLESRSSLTPW